MRFTPQQVENYRAYEKVRSSGRYNMILEDLRACRAARLSGIEYSFVQEHFLELRTQSEDEDKSKASV